MNKKKVILAAVMGMTACTVAFVGGMVKVYKNARKSEQQLFKTLAAKAEETEWLAAELEECEDDNDSLREQLASANAEIYRLQDLQRGIR